MTLSSHGPFPQAGRGLLPLDSFSSSWTISLPLGMGFFKWRLHDSRCNVPVQVRLAIADESLFQLDIGRTTALRAPLRECSLWNTEKLGRLFRRKQLLTHHPTSRFLHVGQPRAIAPAVISLWAIAGAQPIARLHPHERDDVSGRPGARVAGRLEQSHLAPLVLAAPFAFAFIASSPSLRSASALAAQKMQAKQVTRDRANPASVRAFKLFG